MSDELITLDAGIAAADGPEKSKEYADVAKWANRLDQARKFDEPARVQYARDRRYARGDSGGEVDANIAGTNIDILESFLYAKDPDFDVTQGPSVRPPSMETLRDAAEDAVSQMPEVLEAGRQAAAQGIAMGMPQDIALQTGQLASQVKTDDLVKTKIEEMRKAFQKRQREIKAFAETCEIIGSSLWHDASLKRRGRPWVRSGLTIGIGVIKASWQERTAPSPETTTGINDMQANIARAKAQLKALTDGDAGFIARAVDGVMSAFGNDQEAKLAEYERQLATLQAQPEMVMSRGFVVDCVAGEDFQVAPGFTIANHLDAPWNAHRIFMAYDDACAFANVPIESMREATRYSARKPEMTKRQAALIDPNVDAKDADAYTVGETAEGGDFVALWEIWDRDTNSVLTRIEGVKCWVKPAWNPVATTRFYPFFLFCTSEVDGQRHPQSLITRAAKLLDEYNRIGSAEAEHRRRVRPKTMFNAGAMDAANAKKLETGTTQEMVAVNTTVPKADLRGILVPVTYAALDPALYDRTRIVTEIERIFGTSEALAGAGSTTVAKTATQTEIENTGFQARTGGRREQVEIALSDLALYTVEIARAYVTLEDAQAIAGPNATWPTYTGPDDLLRLVSVDIRAGSSGKPNTSAERESWGTLLPMLQAGVMQIGQLRQSSPIDIADSLEKLLRVTAERSGERFDIDDLLPPAGQPAPVPGMPGAPVDPNAPPEAGGAPVEEAPAAMTA
jgi:hypothetical protein